LALLFLLLPAYFLNEKRYARQQASELGIRKALLVVVANVNFRRFLLSDLLYWLALTFIQLGVGFYTTLLLELDKAYAFVFSLVSFLASFLFYVPVNVLAKKLGKKRLLLAAFLLFALVFVGVAFIRSIPLPPLWILYGLAFFAALPLAVFGIVPNALIGDLVETEEHRSGRRLSGMFYGVRAFVMKLGISLANLIFPSLLLLGKSLDNSAGVQATAFAAVLFCLGGWRALVMMKDVLDMPES